jgi:hypothetical protein
MASPRRSPSSRAIASACSWKPSGHLEKPPPCFAKPLTLLGPNSADRGFFEVSDRQAREEAIVNSAWGLVGAAKEEGTGNVGLISALETLHTRGIELNQVNLPGAYLQEVQLPRASLFRADLHEADLARASLGDADFGSELCLTKMPDTSSCNRDCSSDRSCPFLDSRTP